MTQAQWPTLPMPGDEPERDPREPANIEYTLLVEQLVGSGNTMRWLAEAITRQTWQERDRVRREAEHCAWTFQPRHPMSEQRRSVYRVSPDEYMTIVEGATQTFSFRTLVAEPLGYRTAR